MKITILGGNGYIGSVLGPELVKKGHKLTIIDKKEPFKHFKAEFIDKDLYKVNKKTLEGSEAVIQLAGLTPEKGWSKKSLRDGNVVLTSKLAEAAKRAGVDNYIYASSTSVLGTSFYGETKWRAEQQLKNISSELFNVTVFRIGNVYGYSPVMRWDGIINSCIKSVLNEKRIQIKGDMNAMRPVVYLNDLVNAFEYAANNPSRIFDWYYVSEANHMVIFMALEAAKVMRDMGYDAKFDLKRGFSPSYKAEGNNYFKINDIKTTELKEAIKKMVSEVLKNE